MLAIIAAFNLTAIGSGNTDSTVTVARAVAIVHDNVIVRAVLNALDDHDTTFFLSIPGAAVTFGIFLVNKDDMRARLPITKYMKALLAPVFEKTTKEKNAPSDMFLTISD